MVQGIYGVLSFTVAVCTVLPAMTHAMSVQEVHAIRMYRPARNAAKVAFTKTQSSDLSELCANATVHGKMNKAANYVDMPFTILALARQRRLPVYVPVYEYPSVRFISNSIRMVISLHALFMSP